MDMIPGLRLVLTGLKAEICMIYLSDIDTRSTLLNAYYYGFICLTFICLLQSSSCNLCRCVVITEYTLTLSNELRLKCHISFFTNIKKFRRDRLKFYDNQTLIIKIHRNFTQNIRY